MHEARTDGEQELTLRELDASAASFIREDNKTGRIAEDKPLRIHSNNLDARPSTGTSISTFVRAVGVGICNTEILMTTKNKRSEEIGWARDRDGGCKTDHRQNIKHHLK